MHTGQEDHFERALHLLGLSLKTGQVVALSLSLNPTLTLTLTITLTKIEDTEATRGFCL